MNNASETIRRRRLLTGRYVTLLMALLSVAVLEPLLSKPWVLNVFFTLVLLSAVWALSRNRWQWIAALGLAFPNLLVKWTLWFLSESTSFVVTNTTLSTIHGILNLTFLAFVALMMLGHVMRSRQVTSDTICGAICVYIMMGLAWAEAYTVVDVRDQAAFHHVDQAEVEALAAAEDASKEKSSREARAADEASRSAEGDEAEHEEAEHEEAVADKDAENEEAKELVALVDTDPSHNFGSYVYFSYTTLTTLGYGDITPVSRVARTLAWLEAVTGQLFLAVLIARLVGLHLVHEERVTQALRERDQAAAKAGGKPPLIDDEDDVIEERELDELEDEREDLDS